MTAVSFLPHCLRVELSCRCCGDRLEQVNAGSTDGVRASWVGKCVTCRREFAVVAEMVALRPSAFQENQHTKQKVAAHA